MLSKDIRQKDTDAFYKILSLLEKRTGGKRRIDDCDGRMDWPKRGVYFFFEPEEFRDHPASIPRVVRVGTHALTADSQTTLQDRLIQHRGSIRPKGGNHRGSVFRRMAGEAMRNRDPSSGPDTWGTGSSASRAVRSAERALECLVSDYIGDMELLFVSVPDEPGRQSLRGVIERNSIALLSSFMDPSPDRPSSGWLGLSSSNERVQRSGIWNNNHVGEDCHPDFLDLFRKTVRRTRSS